MKNRSTALVMALALSASMLTACGSKTQPTQSSASGSTPDASLSTPAASSLIPDLSQPDVSEPAQPEADQSQGAVVTPDLSAPSVSAPAVSTPAKSEPKLEEVASLSLNKTDFTLFKAGDSYRLQAIETNPSGKPYTWTSNNEAVATVSEDGTVTAVAPGNAVITIQSGELSAVCTVRCKFEASTPASGTVSTPSQTPEQQPEQKPENQPTQTPEQKPENQPTQTPEQNTPAASSVDLAAFYNKIITSVDEENRPFMAEYDAGMLDGWYPGLTAVNLKQRVMYAAAISAVPIELAFVECENAADVSTVKGIFQARIDGMVNNHMNYPSVLDTWENEAKILTNGNYVALIVIPSDSGLMDAASAFKALF